MPTRCTATTAAERPCRAWAVRETDPPRCTAHRDRDRRQKEAAAQEAAAKQAALLAQIDDLDARIARLGEYIDGRRKELDVGDLCRLLDLHSKMLGRVTRMRRAQNDLDGNQSVLMDATHEVLDGISDKVGVPL